MVHYNYRIDLESLIENSQRADGVLRSTACVADDGVFCERSVSLCSASRAITDRRFQISRNSLVSREGRHR